MIRDGADFLSSGQERLDDGEGPEDVGLVGLLEHRQSQVGRLGARGELGADPGVVDQHVEATETLVEPSGGVLGGGRVGDVQPDPLDVQALAPEPVGGGVDLGLVTGGEGDREAELAELATDLEADPLVRPRHQGHFLLVHRLSLSIPGRPSRNASETDRTDSTDS